LTSNDTRPSAYIDALPDRNTRYSLATNWERRPKRERQNIARHGKIARRDCNSKRDHEGSRPFKKGGKKEGKEEESKSDTFAIEKARVPRDALQALVNHFLNYTANSGASFLMISRFRFPARETNGIN